MARRAVESHDSGSFEAAGTGGDSLLLREQRSPAEWANPADRWPGNRPAAEPHDDIGDLARLIMPLRGERAAPLSAELIGHFGSLPALMRAGTATLARRLPSDPMLVELLLAVGPLSNALLRAEMLDAPVLPDNLAALRYLHGSMAHEPAEQVRMLYLDAKNRIIRDEVAAKGTITRTDIFPREIVRRALEVGASSLIMAHNHPTGPILITHDHAIAH